MRWKLRAIAATAVLVLALAPTAAHAQQYPPSGGGGGGNGGGSGQGQQPGGADDGQGATGGGADEGGGASAGGGAGAETPDDGEVLGESATNGAAGSAVSSGGLAFTGAQVLLLTIVGLASLVVGTMIVLGVRAGGAQRRRALTTSR